MKKKKILNICMILAVVMAIVCGVMAVGSVKGWFDGEKTVSDMTVIEKKGIVMIERSGVAYELTEDTVIKNGDRLYTKAASELVIGTSEKAGIYLTPNAEIIMEEIGTSPVVTIVKGNALVDARVFDMAIEKSENEKITLNKAVASISSQAGSKMIYVFSGNVEVEKSESKESFSVEAGNVVAIINEKGTHEIKEMSAKDLSDSQLTQLQNCGVDEGFCFTEEDIVNTKKAREEEKLKAQQEAIKEFANTQTDNKLKENEPEENGQGEGDKPVEEEVPKLTCSIKIVCDTILNNMSDLTAGKEGYVPSSGVILDTLEVEFQEGETVFDVLQRVCKNGGIQLEYSYTPIYESYYIEGINHLYEFDCGGESGWMYKVNGWFPNYGCSGYNVSEGDVIVWCYTCKGLGEDVGGSNF